MVPNKETGNNGIINYWWSTALENLISAFLTNPEQGLTNEQVEKNRIAFGSNLLEEIKPMSIWGLILEGIKEPMMILLLSIAGLSLLFGKPIEATVMIFVVMAYIAVEFINKFRTDRTMTRLRELTQPLTKVIREGKILEVQTAEVVVGDIVILSDGVRIPADMRLIESIGLDINEAPLTGESLPIRKDAHAKIAEETLLAERQNCVFSGTIILAGEGRGIVVKVGKKSELGIIAHEIQGQKKEKTFTQNAMTRLAKNLAVIAIFVSILIPAIGLLRGLDLQTMILTWLALTFLMIPGQPPIIITMALALASFELADKKLAVKRLHGVEVLGQVSAIITDKTGTITENKMKVDGFILPDGQEVEPHELSETLRNQINFCLPLYSNDPTDKAVSEAVNVMNKKYHYTAMENFSDTHPWRSLFYNGETSPFYAIAGQPEKLVALLNTKQKEKLLETIRDQAIKGNRIVGFALKQGADPSDDLFKDSQLLALAVLSDPVRTGVKEAIATLEKSGITTYMVTGDHMATADYIAKLIGIESAVLEGRDLEKMDDQSLLASLQSVKVFARISPALKKRLAMLLKKKGEIVAVIGDGVNDAPALKEADVGIAMGEIGTDLAKETADLILTDDSYVHLPQAIAIGRKALDNFRKGLTYYLSAKAILLSIFLVPLLLGIPFPFAPIYIILTELLMDLASSTIFVTEAAESDILERRPRRVTEFLNKTIALKILKNSFFLTVGILLVYLSLYYKTHNLILAQTASFVTWLLGHIMLALNLKQEKLPLLRQGIFSNRFGIAWLFGMAALSLVITLIPFVHPYLHTTSLSLGIWIFILVVVLSSTWWIELIKTIQNRN